MSDASGPPHLDEHLCFAMYSANIAINRLYRPVLDRLGITYPQYLVMNVLWEHDGRAIGEIAGRLALEPSTITPLVKRLEGAGFVRRVRNPDDERQVVVSLSDAGRSLRADAKCVTEALLTQSGRPIAELARLNREIVALRETLVGIGDEAD